MSMLTMQDIADLAKVRRQVVSMWRKRPIVRGVSMPFPEAVAMVDGVERFGRDEIVEWLERTGRGNNREFELDAPTLSVPDGVALQDVVTMLCWSAATGKEVSESTAQERVARAAEVDPDDSYLLREIQALRPSPELVGYVDDLVEGSFRHTDALSRLEHGRLKRAIGTRDLSEDAVRLMRAVVDGCRDHIGRDNVALRVDDVAYALNLVDDFDHHVVADDRATRRRALINGMSLEPSRVPAGISVDSLAGCDVPEVLERLDEVVLGLKPGDVAVLIGPAAALADPLRGAPQLARAQTLRGGSLIAALRLPRGMWREAHRQSLSVWVCQGGAHAASVRVADLAAVADLDLDDLAMDIAAALAGTVRAYRYMRPVQVESVLAGGPLVPLGARVPVLRTTDSRSYLDRVHRATLTTSTALRSFDVLVAPSSMGMVVAHRSLAELRLDEQLTVKRGSRIDPAHGRVDGTVAVLPAGQVTLDPFDVAKHYPRAMRTDPGDVIFVAKPNPRAWVDSHGGALVAAPARVIRLLPKAEIGPQLLATVINELAETGTEWETWRIPVVGREEAARLEIVLAEAERFESDIRGRLTAAQDLKKALIDGVAAGALTLDAQSTTPGFAGTTR